MPSITIVFLLVAETGKDTTRISVLLCPPPLISTKFCTFIGIFDGFYSGGTDREKLCRVGYRVHIVDHF